MKTEFTESRLESVSNKLNLDKNHWNGLCVCVCVCVRLVYTCTAMFVSTYSQRFHLPVFSALPLPALLSLWSSLSHSGNLLKETNT